MAGSVRTTSDGTLVRDDGAGSLLSPAGLAAITNTIQAITGGSGATSQTGKTTSAGTSSTTGTSTSTGTTTNVGSSTTSGATSGTTAGTSSQDSSSALAIKLLEQIAPGIISRSSGSDFSREQAIADSKGLVDEIMRNLSESTLPQIYSAEGSRGAYNSTSKALLSNDAAARAAGQAAATQADVVSRYGQIQSSRDQALIGLVNAAAQAQRTTTGTTTGTQTGTSNTNVATGTTGTTVNTGTTTNDTTTAQTGTTDVNATTSTDGLGSSRGFNTAAGATAAYGIAQALLKNPNITAAGSAALTKIANWFNPATFGGDGGPGVDVGADVWGQIADPLAQLSPSEIVTALGITDVDAIADLGIDIGDLGWFDW